MDVILKNLTEEQFDLLSMAIDGSLGYSLTDANYDTQATHLITQLQAIRQSILEFRGSIMTDEEMREMSESADSYGHYLEQAEVFEQHLVLGDVILDYNTHH